MVHKFFPKYHPLCVKYKKRYFVTYAEVSDGYFDDIQCLFSRLYQYWLIYLQHWEKLFNIIRIPILYFSISNKEYFFILNTYLVDDILGEIYVPWKYSQNIFTSVSWDACSVIKAWSKLEDIFIIFTTEAIVRCWC